MIDKQINVGLIGFGVVGAGTAACLLDNSKQIEARAGAAVRLKTIADLDITTPRPVDVSDIELTTDYKQLLIDPAIDIVVELVGGTTVAYDVVAAALQHDKDVVTANKALLAKRGHELFQLARESGRLLLYEAAVGGGIPIIQALKTGVCSTAMRSIYGILNGTVNYILTRMEEAGLGFQEALSEAQDKGYAEADPTFDIEGQDTGHKIVLLAQQAFGCPVDFESVPLEGISRLSFFDLQMAQELGYRIKLLAVAKLVDQALDIRVQPTLIPHDSQLGAVMGVYNAVMLEGSPLGKAMFYGEGAGGGATGAAVVADIMEAARQRLTGTANNHFAFDHQDIDRLPLADSRSGYYLKLIVEDYPGVLAQITRCLGEAQVSIASVIQKEAIDTDAGVPVVITTHASEHRGMQKALQDLSQLEAVLEEPFTMRIENLTT